MFVTYFKTGKKRTFSQALGICFLDKCCHWKLTEEKKKATQAIREQNLCKPSFEMTHYCQENIPCILEPKLSLENYRFEAPMCQISWERNLCGDGPLSTTNFVTSKSMLCLIDRLRNFPVRLFKSQPLDSHVLPGVDPDSVRLFKQEENEVGLNLSFSTGHSIPVA